ncbi:hypothetical protein ACOMHN_025567 [Nucella lapillus]
MPTLWAVKHCFWGTSTSAGTAQRTPTLSKPSTSWTCFSLSQAVNFPTHRNGHTIDWCVFREEELILRSVSRGPSLTSDHMPVMCYLDIAKPASTPVFQTVRNLRAIDKSQIRADVATVFHNQPPATVEQLEAHLRAVLDVHAPAIRRLQTQRRSSPCGVTSRASQGQLDVNVDL